MIDNSSYAAVPHWHYIGFGKEIDFVKNCAINTPYRGQLQIYGFDKTHWTSDPNSPNFFSESRMQIRRILEPAHLKIQAKYPKPKYISYHSARDLLISPIADKIELYEKLNALSFDTDLKIIKDESDIDGKFIKTLEHGMDMSLKTLLQREVPTALTYIASSVATECEKSIVYPTEQWIYHFYEKDGKLDFKALNAD